MPNKFDSVTHGLEPEYYGPTWDDQAAAQKTNPPGENHFEHHNKCECTERERHFRASQKFRHNNHKDTMV